jgi:hypothetical protein
MGYIAVQGQAWIGLSSFLFKITFLNQKRKKKNRKKKKKRKTRKIDTENMEWVCGNIFFPVR